MQSIKSSFLAFDRCGAFDWKGPATSRRSWSSTAWSFANSRQLCQHRDSSTCLGTFVGKRLGSRNSDISWRGHSAHWCDASESVLISRLEIPNSDDGSMYDRAVQVFSSSRLLRDWSSRLRSRLHSSASRRGKSRSHSSAKTRAGSVTPPNP